MVRNQETPKNSASQEIGSPGASTDPHEELLTPVELEARDFASLLHEISDPVSAKELLESAAGKFAGFQKIDGNNYAYLGFRFQLDLSMYAVKEEQALATVNSIGINSAPQLINNISLGSGESLLITYHAGCESGPAVPYERWTGKLSEDAKNRLRDDINRLTDAGWQHPFAYKGFAHWQIAPDNGQIMLNSWSHLTPLRAEQKDLYLQTMCKMIEKA